MTLTAANLESVNKVLSVATSTMTKTDCSLAPKCLILHRKNCSVVVNTCGECLEGYLGASGSQNTPCVNTAMMLSSSTGGIAASKCSSDKDCSIIQTCNPLSQQCEVLPKQCPNDCSGHGDCL